MKLCITAGNYHIFKLMIKNHKDSRIQLKERFKGVVGSFVPWGILFLKGMTLKPGQRYIKGE